MEKCLECGVGMEFKIIDSTQGWYCQKCDHSIITTFIEPIKLDEQDYTIYLLCGNDKDVNQIRTISQIMNSGFLKAKSILKEKESVLCCGKATEIYKIKNLLNENGIRYHISPKYIY